MAFNGSPYAVACGITTKGILHKKQLYKCRVSPVPGNGNRRNSVYAKHIDLSAKKE